MRLKDYLRGLGMGMIVVVLILVIAGRDRTMTDEEIIARARQLGMVDGNQTLTNIKDKESTFQEEVSEPDVQEEPYEGSIASESATESFDAEETEETTESSKVEEKEESTGTPEATETEEGTGNSETVEEVTTTEQDATLDGAADASKAPAEVKAITVTVQRGDSSVSVSKDLETAGAVESAKDFDRYLCEHGYDKRISVGTFEITLGATYEEMAKIITKSK